MCFTDYVAFGMCILAFTLVTLYMTITEKMNFDKEMEDMSTKERDYKVLRNNRVMDVSNRFIVPGDVVFVVDGSTPFDGIMLEGTVLIDESSLTG
jgi:P-type E1-E2 ATPase